MIKLKSKEILERAAQELNIDEQILKDSLLNAALKKFSEDAAKAGGYSELLIFLSKW